MKKVSIVLPVYNGGKHICQSIESVLGQTHSNFELIIVDDCSTDDTPALIQKYAAFDARIKIITNETNLKLPASLNVGFRHAEGDYFSWTSDDNYFKPNAIKTMVDFLEENTEYGMVYCDMTYVDAEGGFLWNHQAHEPDKLLYGNTVGACFLYRSAIARGIGEYDASLFLAEDYEYWLRIYQTAKIKHLPEDLYYYRRHNKSLTETRENEIKAQTCKAWDKHFQFISDSLSPKEFCRFLDGYIARRKASDMEGVRREMKEKYPFYRRHLFLKKLGISR